MNKQEREARKEGFQASSVSECPYIHGKLQRAWMGGFKEGEEFLKRVGAMECPICYETFGHAPGCPNDLEDE